MTRVESSCTTGEDGFDIATRVIAEEFRVLRLTGSGGLRLTRLRFFATVVGCRGGFSRGGRLGWWTPPAAFYWVGSGD